MDSGFRVQSAIEGAGFRVRVHGLERYYPTYSGTSIRILTVLTDAGWEVQFGVGLNDPWRGKKRL